MNDSNSSTTSLALPIRTWFSEWARWWADQSSFQKIMPVSFVAVYWSSLWLLKGFRQDHLQMGILILLLCYSGRQAWAILRFILPLLLTGIIYDSQRFYSDSIRGPIHVSEPYLFDKNYFGIQTSRGLLTPNEWFQLHTHPALDFISGFFYLTFIAIFVLIAAYFYFYASKGGTPKRSSKWISQRASRVMWAFFWLNLIGYSTYYWYAAAPPWYVTLYGLGPARLDALPNPAGCVRFDQLLGTHFFTGMYGRSADVFGAIPSLHIAYPLLAVYYAFQFGTARIFSILFYGVMCFSAVYLNHHYILDIIWGSAYALMIGVVTDLICDKALRS